MRKHAFINNDRVTSVQLLDEEEVASASLQNDMVLDIEDMEPQPDVDWLLIGNALQPFTEMSEEERQICLAQKKMVVGGQISSTAIAKVGARNKMLNKTVQQITSLLSTLSGVKAFLETGALGTARDIITQVKAGYPEYNDIFDEAVQAINDFESKYGL